VTGARRTAAAAFLVGILTAAVLWPVTANDFVDYDDDVYVTRNPFVHGGLTPDGIVWALTATESANWHPLTWLSHMADVSVFRLDPWGHHLTSLLLHAAAAVLLFVVLRGMTGALWRSALAAALFAVHPLHVESVAWVAERKDVLSGFFFMLVLGAYLAYIRRPGPGRYALTALALGLGLMAKPMLVTVPPLLLLLDWWPLGRLGTRSGGAVPVRRILLEKVPLLAMAAASAIVTYIVQNEGGAVRSMTAYSAAVRLANALESILMYLGKTVWPTGLAVFYPHPGVVPPFPSLTLAVFALVAGTLAILAARGRRPHLAAGWAWYLVMLPPVIGFVQIGEQARADRYTYLPLIGLFVALAWSMPDPARSRKRAAMAVVAALAAVVVLSVAARVQIGFWRDGETLFRRDLAVVGESYVALDNLAAILRARGKTREALLHSSRAFQLRHGTARQHFDLGTALAREGLFKESELQYTIGLEIEPKSPHGHRGLGRVLTALGRPDEAAVHLRAARLPDLESGTGDGPGLPLEERDTRTSWGTVR
jgi:tetratricopeptide (TPR) repeat protein